MTWMDYGIKTFCNLWLWAQNTEHGIRDSNVLPCLGTGNSSVWSVAFGRWSRAINHTKFFFSLHLGKIFGSIDCSIMKLMYDDVLLLVNIRVFSIFSTKVCASLDASILLCSWHNNVTSFERTTTLIQKQFKRKQIYVCNLQD